MKLYVFYIWLIYLIDGRIIIYILIDGKVSIYIF